MSEAWHRAEQAAEKESVSLYFLKACAPYGPGDQAGFKLEDAMRYLNGGFAILYSEFEEMSAEEKAEVPRPQAKKSAKKKAASKKKG